MIGTARQSGWKFQPILAEFVQNAQGLTEVSITLDGEKSPFK